MHIVPSQAIEDLFSRQYGLVNVTLSDESYLAPTMEWVTGTLASTWSSVKTVLGINEYIVDARDCDDYTTMCAAYVRILHGLTVKAENLPSSGIAFGEFWFTSHNGPHALNVFLVAEDGRLTMNFFEPQTGKLEILSDNEIKSAMFIRF